MPVDLPTREDFFQIGAQEVFARGQSRPQRTRVSPQAVFTEGTDINIIIAACSAMADEGTRHLALRMAALFLDSAEGVDLDRFVADRFSPTIVRKQPAPAVTLLVVTRPIPPSAGAAVSLPVGTKVRTELGTEFELTQPLSLTVGSSGPASAAAQAVFAGTGGNVGAGELTQFVNTPADATLVVTNPEAAAGGANQESDASLRERARDFFRTARRATLDAIEFGARTVDGVVEATAIEVIDPATGLQTGVVQLYITDAAGRSNALIADAVRSALREWRAGGIIVDVIATQPRFEPVNFVLSFAAGTDTRAAVNQLKALTVAAVNVHAPQEPLRRSLLFALARSIPGAIVPETAVQVPAGDVVPSSGQVIKTRLDLVTVNGI
jgi:uncharacterized phage protein gp47/JayE